MRQFIESFHNFHGSQIDGTEYNLIFFTRFDIHLKRRLSIQFNRYVDHIASFVQTIRRRISPSSCQINAHRTSAPHYLISINIQSGLLFPSQSSIGKSFPHQTESSVLKFLIRLSFQLHHPGTEHLVTDAGHHRSCIGKRLWQGQPLKRILAGSIFQIKLIEHTMFIILSQKTPIGHPESIPLSSQTTQIGIRRNFIGRHLPAAHPCLLPFHQRRFRHHPTHHQPQFFYRVGHREDTCSLQIMCQFHIL